MNIEVYVNGDSGDDGTALSLTAHAIEGQYDSQLNWPLVGSITITLLNQVEDKNHHSETLELTREVDMRVGCSSGHCCNFHLDYDPNKNTQYLKDDTLYFRTAVAEEVHKQQPWLEWTTLTNSYGDIS